MKSLAAFVRLSRAHFLPLPMLTYAVGIAFAERDGVVVQPRLLVGGLVIELLIQLSVAYTNDYWDMPTDRINTSRTLLSGGSGELTTGLLPPYAALVAAAVCQVGAVISAVRLGLAATSWVILAGTLALATFYTTPPVKLSWRRLGELTTASVAALIVPQWAYSLQTGHLSGGLFVLCLPLLPTLMALFLVIAAPDYEADRRVGKHTLAVTTGEEGVGALYASLIALGFIACVLIWPGRVAGMTFGVLLLGVPVAVWAWSGLRAPFRKERFALVLMIVRAGLVALVVVLALNIGLRLD